MTEIELNPHLNWPKLVEAYKKKERLQITNFLTASSAEGLLQCLERDVNWHLAYLDEEPGLISYEALQQKSPEEFRAFQKRLAGIANQAEFHYLYDCYPLLQAYKENWDPSLYINKWLEFVNTEAILGVIRKLTGIEDIARCDAQAARYGPNHYLTRHTDDVPSEGRRVAYVLNLSRQWDPNWGGYLQFFDNGRNLSDGFMPEFNTLSLFTVPQDHSVSCISQFSKHYRYTLVGWFRAAE